MTQNPVGNVGVYQGNGGDAPHVRVSADTDETHVTLRIADDGPGIAPEIERVAEVVADHDHVRELLDNGWLSLTVVDPEQEYESFHYEGALSWADGAVSVDAGTRGTEAVDADARDTEAVDTAVERATED